MRISARPPPPADHSSRTNEAIVYARRGNLGDRASLLGGFACFVNSSTPSGTRSTQSLNDVLSIDGVNAFLKTQVRLDDAAGVDAMLINAADRYRLDGVTRVSADVQRETSVLDDVVSVCVRGPAKVRVGAYRKLVLMMRPVYVELHKVDLGDGKVTAQWSIRVNFDGTRRDTLLGYHELGRVLDTKPDPYDLEMCLVHVKVRPFATGDGPLAGTKRPSAPSGDPRATRKTEEAIKRRKREEAEAQRKKKEAEEQRKKKEAEKQRKKKEAEEQRKREEAEKQSAREQEEMTRNMEEAKALQLAAETRLQELDEMLDQAENSNEYLDSLALDEVPELEPSPLRKRLLSKQSTAVPPELTEEMLRDFSDDTKVRLTRKYNRACVAKQKAFYMKLAEVDATIWSLYTNPRNPSDEPDIPEPVLPSLEPYMKTDEARKWLLNAYQYHLLQKRGELMSTGGFFDDETKVVWWLDNYWNDVEDFGKTFVPELAVSSDVTWSLDNLDLLKQQRKSLYADNYMRVTELEYNRKQAIWDDFKEYHAKGMYDSLKDMEKAYGNVLRLFEADDPLVSTQEDRFVDSLPNDIYTVNLFTEIRDKFSSQRLMIQQEYDELAFKKDIDNNVNDAGSATPRMQSMGTGTPRVSSEQMDQKERAFSAWLKGLTELWLLKNQLSIDALKTDTGSLVKYKQSMEKQRQELEDESERYQELSSMLQPLLATSEERLADIKTYLEELESYMNEERLEIIQDVDNFRTKHPVLAVYKDLNDAQTYDDIRTVVNQYGDTEKETWTTMRDEVAALQVRIQRVFEDDTIEARMKQMKLDLKLTEETWEYFSTQITKFDQIWGILDDATKASQNPDVGVDELERQLKNVNSIAIDTVDGDDAIKMLEEKTWKLVETYQKSTRKLLTDTLNEASRAGLEAAEQAAKEAAKQAEATRLKSQAERELRDKREALYQQASQNQLEAAEQAAKEAAKQAEATRLKSQAERERRNVMNSLTERLASERSDEDDQELKTSLAEAEEWFQTNLTTKGPSAVDLYLADNRPSAFVANANARRVLLSAAIFDYQQAVDPSNPYARLQEYVKLSTRAFKEGTMDQGKEKKLDLAWAMGQKDAYMRNFFMYTKQYSFYKELVDSDIKIDKQVLSVWFDFKTLPSSHASMSDDIQNLVKGTTMYVVAQSMQQINKNNATTQSKLQRYKNKIGNASEELTQGLKKWYKETGFDDEEYLKLLGFETDKAGQ